MKSSYRPGLAFTILLLLVLLPVCATFVTPGEGPSGPPPVDDTTETRSSGEPLTLTEADLEVRNLRLATLPHEVTDSKSIAVGDADNDGEIELLTTDDWNVSFWQWDGGNLVYDGGFRVPFQVDAANRGIVSACIADADGEPGNETLLVAAATDVGGDPYDCRGGLFVYGHDSQEGYYGIDQVSTGTISERAITFGMETEGAWGIDNALEVADLNGDGIPEVILGIAFYTRTTRIYNLLGDPPQFYLLWEDPVMTGDGNAVLPIVVGGETVLYVGMGYGDPPEEGFQVRSVRWNATTGMFYKGPTTDAQGAVWDMEVCDLDGDGMEEIIASVHYDLGGIDGRTHIRVMRPRANLTLETLLVLDQANQPYGIWPADILPSPGLEVLVAYNHYPPRLFSFAGGLASPVAYNLSGYDMEGDNVLEFFMVLGTEGGDIIGGMAGGFLRLRCEPDLSLDMMEDVFNGTIELGPGEEDVSVPVTNVGALGSPVAHLRLTLEGGWTRTVDLPPVQAGEDVIIDLPLPPGPYDGNVTISIEHSTGEADVFDWNDRWEGHLSIPPVSSGSSGEPWNPYPWILVIALVVVVTVATVQVRRTRVISRGDRGRLFPPILAWKRNSMARSERVLEYMRDRDWRGARVSDVAEALHQSANTARKYLLMLFRDGRLNRFDTSSGWLYVVSGVDPPPGTLHGLGRTASSLYGLVLSRPGLLRGELISQATEGLPEAERMSERMIEYNLATLIEYGLVVKRPSPLEGTEVHPRAFLLVRDHLGVDPAGIEWNVVQGALRNEGIRMTRLEFDLMAPGLGVRTVSRSGGMWIVPE